MLLIGILQFLMLLLVSCHHERPLVPVVQDPQRFLKADLEGEFYFIRTVTDVKRSGSLTQQLRAGIFVDHSRLVKIDLSLEFAQVVSVSQDYSIYGKQKNLIVSSFGLKHVDILPKKTLSGKSVGHRPEVNLTDRPPLQRKYVVLDLNRDRADLNSDDLVSSELYDLPKWDQKKRHLTFSLLKSYRDRSQLIERYSFLRKQSATFQPVIFDEMEKKSIGYFTTKKFDYGKLQVPSKSLTTYLVHHQSFPVVFHFHKDYPHQYRKYAEQVIEKWNSELCLLLKTEALPLQISEVDATHKGRLDQSVLYWDDSQHSSLSYLAYAPMSVDPESGRIIKSDIIFYENSFLHSLAQQDVSHQIRKKKSLSKASKSFFRSLVSLPMLSLFGSLKVNSSQTRKPGSLSLNGQHKKTLHHAVLQNAFVTPLLFDSTLSDHMQNFDNKSLFQWVFSHELGHTLGLRHNHMGSTTEVMLKAQSNMTAMPFSYQEFGPGDYDREALKFVYQTKKVSGRQPHLHQLYPYCTDEDVPHLFLRYEFKGHPRCSRLQLSSDLQIRFEELRGLYETYYNLRNFKNDRLFYEESRPQYEGQVRQLLGSMRYLYDYCTVLEHLRNYQVDQLDRYLEGAQTLGFANDENKKTLVALQLKNDAIACSTVKSEVISYLSDLVLSQDLAEEDQVNYSGEITRMGVYFDKVYALYLLLYPVEEKVLGLTLSPEVSSFREVKEVVMSVFMNRDLRGKNKNIMSYQGVSEGLRKQMVGLLLQTEKSPYQYKSLSRQVVNEFRESTTSSGVKERVASAETVTRVRATFESVIQSQIDIFIQKSLNLRAPLLKTRQELKRLDKKGKDEESQRVREKKQRDDKLLQLSLQLHQHYRETNQVMSSFLEQEDQSGKKPYTLFELMKFQMAFARIFIEVLDDMFLQYQEKVDARVAGDTPFTVADLTQPKNSRAAAQYAFEEQSLKWFEQKKQATQRSILEDTHFLQWLQRRLEKY